MYLKNCLYCAHHLFSFSIKHTYMYSYRLVHVSWNSCLWKAGRVSSSSTEISWWIQMLETLLGPQANMQSFTYIISGGNTVESGNYQQYCVLFPALSLVPICSCGLYLGEENQRGLVSLDTSCCCPGLGLQWHTPQHQSESIYQLEFKPGVPYQS